MIYIYSTDIYSYDVHSTYTIYIYTHSRTFDAAYLFLTRARRGPPRVHRETCTHKRARARTRESVK